MEKHSFRRVLGANRPKLCGNCAFPQSFHTRKLDEITVFFVVNEGAQALVKMEGILGVSIEVGISTLLFINVWIL